MNFFIFLLFFLFNFSKAFSLETTAKQAILYDYETKSIIFEKNIDDLMSPSSMSKIMTIYYLFKKIKEGEITIDDEFEVSKKAWKKGGSKMFVKVNDKVLYGKYSGTEISFEGDDLLIMRESDILAIL